MRRFAPLLAIAFVLPLCAAVPASRVKEPNAVFVYGMDGVNGRVRATLYDRERRKAIDHLDAETDLPVYGGGSTESNDAMQFSPATGKIYIRINNVDGYGLTDRIESSLPYDGAIVETDFAFRTVRTVFSCDDCDLDQWIVHPTDPKLYVSIADAYKKSADEFKNAKLAEITLTPKQRTRVIARIPSYSGLHITPDGKKLLTFKQSANSRDPYGALVSVGLRTKSRKQTVVNFPLFNVFSLPISPKSNDVSPDGLEVAYPMSVIDVQTRETDTLIDETELDLDNYFIGWSRDSRKLLFQLKEPGDVDERTEVPLLYDRATDKTWELPLQDAHLLDWAPAQTAILFGKRQDVGFYDLEKREWVFVAQGENGSWVTMPTKRVPKR